jgi:hypothetical protein
VKLQGCEAPTHSGALPWMASNMAIWSPMLELAPSPTEPVTWAAMSERTEGQGGGTERGGVSGGGQLSVPRPPPPLTVAVEVERHHDVEALRLVREERSADVDNDAVACNVGVLALADLLEDLRRSCCHRGVSGEERGAHWPCPPLLAL